MRLIATQDFSWAHRGVQVECFAMRQEIETEDPDLIDVAQREGWAVPEGETTGSEPDGGENEPKKRGKKSAPESKAESASPENK